MGTSGEKRESANAEIIIVASSEEEDVAVEREEKRVNSLHQEEAWGKKEVIGGGRTVVDGEEEEGGCFCCSETLMQFIRKHWSGDGQTDKRIAGNPDPQGSPKPEKVSLRMISHFLGPNHPADIAVACSNTPYCLYLYRGVNLGERQSANIVLIGYFDQQSGVKALRLLDAVKVHVNSNPHVGQTDMNAHSKVDSQLSSNTNTVAVESYLLIKTLKNFGLLLSNLAVFCCDSQDQEENREFVSHLRAFNPGLISLCGLTGLTGRACHTGVTASFGHVLELVRSLHHHYTTCTSTNDSLKELFANTEPYDPSLPLSAQCLFFGRVVQKIANTWRDLAEYFQSLVKTGDARQIAAQLLDPKVKLGVLFLSEALEPLCAFKEVWQWKIGDLAEMLQLLFTLSHTYTMRLLTPSTGEHFLQKRDLALLHDTTKLPSALGINVGAPAHDFLSLQSETGELRKEFLANVAAFYKAVTESLAESFPEQLSELTLRNIAILLKPACNNKVSKSSSRIVLELGIQLGLCSPRSKEAHQLTQEYVQYFSTVEQKEDGRGAGAYQYWTKALQSMGQDSILRRLFLILLALPSSICRELVFAKVFSSSTSTDSLDMKDDLKTPPRQEVSRTMAKPNLRKKRKSSEAGNNNSGEEEADKDCLTDDGKIWENCTEYGEEEIIWGKMEGNYSLWPGYIRPWRVRPPQPEWRLVEWFGIDTCSQVSVEELRPFAAFAQCFCAKSFATVASYKDAISHALQVAARRCNKKLSEIHDNEELLRVLLDWAFGAFEPTGPDGFKPNAVSTGKICKMRKRLLMMETPSSPCPLSVKESFNSSLKQAYVSLEKLSINVLDKFSGSPKTAETFVGEIAKEAGRKEKVARGEGEKEKVEKVHKKKKNSLGELNGNLSPEYLPPLKKKHITKVYAKAKDQDCVYVQPDQNHREETIVRIMKNKLDIEAFCLCCGTKDIEIFHPLFEGGLCLRCKDNFTETLYRYDDDGYQSYCTICCYGMEVILCGNDSCCRSYCLDCLNILVGPSTFECLKEIDPWICYLCQPHGQHGALIPRKDWSIRVQELFANNSAMEFEPHRVYPSIPANQRRPLRVLSLFDGIGTGYLVLKDLGFKVEKYIASEICDDSISVSNVNHEGKIIHVNDVRLVTKDHIKQWGPFDLLIGGSPCNDLSIVNPLRKGIYGGTGRLFFEFYRILHLLKPKENDPRPFFWLFENVTFMNTHDKVNICRFLECNPVLVDAVKVSPAHRARYFWGNIPGMNRPITASQNDKLKLQDCLEVGREAKFTKVRTITTNPNSLKQGKNVSLLPVLHNGKEDNLWITELEKIFGFPKHYTDIRNMNRQQRQKVLGKSWSVPVIRHLFAPLKDYFACEELPSLSISSTSPDLPDPQPQQLE
ncbi:DNA (cytosine-5-)-methyltransferase beta, duplicate b.3 [Lampris incognitus]|uniref:DNA (cytosine-5-)-methyltransferase beta, duplicate b.3 n=1 Tax=Lampris incognitus TaxID=2546036 RepID=UPI0024B4A17E|nr:DNA (cytosine-5-)-methyltransferase beta, duplicate b.3 [Lampris incognitus]